MSAGRRLGGLSAATSRLAWAPWAVLGLIWAIALLDFVTGVRLLTDPAPWLLNGHDRLWTAMPTAGREDPATMSLLRMLEGRLGAFSIYAALVSAVWGWLSRQDRRSRTALLLTYTLAGVPLSYVDHRYFAGTTYLLLKDVIGVAWTVALVLHFAVRPRSSWPQEQTPQVILGGSESP